MSHVRVTGAALVRPRDSLDLIDKASRDAWALFRVSPASLQPHLVERGCYGRSTNAPGIA
jgi:hypothetical protein